MAETVARRFAGYQIVWKRTENRNLLQRGHVGRNIDPKAYVDTHLNPTLEPALVALCRARPADPVTWLAEYLIAHKRRRLSQTANPAALLQQLLAASKTPCALPVRTHSRRIQSAAYAASVPAASCPLILLR